LFCWFLDVYVDFKCSRSVVDVQFWISVYDCYCCQTASGLNLLPKFMDLLEDRLLLLFFFLLDDNSFCNRCGIWWQFLCNICSALLWLDWWSPPDTVLLWMQLACWDTNSFLCCSQIFVRLYSLYFSLFVIMIWWWLRWSDQLSFELMFVDFCLCVLFLFILFSRIYFLFSYFFVSSVLYIWWFNFIFFWLDLSCQF